jgi:starch phosphorylase
MAEQQSRDLSETFRFLAGNLRWSWHHPTTALFERVDPILWKQTDHNPVALLSSVGADRIAALAADRAFVDEADALAANLRAYLDETDTWYHRRGAAGRPLSVAYFSAEFAITECLHIFSGGLGVLAGDHLKSASDLGVPLTAVGLLYREGYFVQSVDAEGRQAESYPRQDFDQLPITLMRRPDGQPLLVDFPYRDSRCWAQVWRADVGRVPLYLLDTDVAANQAADRGITDRLYGGDNEHRLQQEIVLGIGGMRALTALGIAPAVVHLNEGHAAFAAVERVRHAIRAEPGQFGFAALRLADNVVFTTHTPVPAGHDFFPTHLMERYLGGYVWEMREPWDRFLALGRHDPNDRDEPFNMTLLALRLSGRANGVSRLHGEVSRKMWNGVWPELAEEDVPISHITNGVHIPTWIAAPMEKLYDEWIGTKWRTDTGEQRWERARHIPRNDLWAARSAQRERLVQRARAELAQQGARQGRTAASMAWTTDALDPRALTIVFARRFATYKRATLLLSDPNRLVRMLNNPTMPVQFIFAGKAHPRDEPGKDFLRKIAEFAQRLDVRNRFVFLEGYDVDLARDLTAGADVWLNVPRRPYEASGTSGMKAAANGGLNLSIPDGWWAEAWQDHCDKAAPPGWSIEAAHVDAGQDAADAEVLFRLLEEDVIPLFYERNENDVPVRWCHRIFNAIGELSAFFNTHRMVCDYVEHAYLPASAAGASPAQRTERAPARAV